ncbi:MAG: class I SAM-dependent methyltransferase [Thermoanaerobaculia bacterium]
MAHTRADLISLYRKRAGNYNFTANLYYLIGYREWAYRKRAVRALGLRPGDTVVEIACGTGLNFGLYQELVGPQGKVIGVDLNDAMLAEAAKRVERNGWRNTELIHADAARFQFPEGPNAVISTYAITLVAEFDEVIRSGCEALSPGGRFAILDFKRAEWAPQWLVRAFVGITALFGVTLDLVDRHPWESLERYLPGTRFDELYLGFSYLAVGAAQSSLSAIAEGAGPADFS